MIKVLIVDDEKLVRIAMRNIIDWKEHNADVVSYAKDGLEALDVLKSQKVDLVITDLKMPNMDGITLIKEIKKRKINTTIVVLSNHADFDLVRKSMKNGAFDYLLKITIERECIEKILNQINQHLKEKNLFENKLDNKEESISEIFNGLLKDENLSLENYNLDNLRIKNNFIIAAFRIKSKENTINLKKLHLNIENIIKESLGQICYEIFWVSDLEGFLILDEKCNVNYKSMLEKIIKNTKQYINKSLSIILSIEMKNYENLIPCVRMQFEFLEYDFYYEDEIIIFDELLELKSLDYNKIDYHIEILKEAKRKNISRMIVLLNNSIDKLRDSNIKVTDIKGFIKFIFTNLKGLNLYASSKDFSIIDAIIKSVEECINVKQLKLILSESIDPIELFFNSFNSNYRKEVDDVIKYINENIESKISLKMLAKSVSMNESYLSRIFKNETGKNLMFYINEKKMEKAMELLGNKNIMVKEVSAMVGIDDQFYFNKLFKKFHNMNPSDFRKKTYK